TNGNAAQGGGIYCDGASPTIAGCVISNNDATTNGGGLYIANGTINLIDTTIENNRANSGSGGAISSFYSDPVVTNCKFESNTAFNYGGAIDIVYGSGHIVNCVFLSGTGGLGGAISSGGKSGYTTQIVNCTLYGNTADRGGGAIYHGYDGGYLKVTNCILWNNTSTSYADELYTTAPETVTISYCDIEDCKPLGSWDESLGVDGGGNTDDDPLFAAAPVAYWKMDDSAANPWVVGLNGVPTERVKNGTFEDDTEWT
ncbi:unnamed protein product, partial [marine sediment metagenome]